MTERPRNIFEFVRPRTSKAEAKARERLLMKKMQALLEIGDELTLIEALKKDFGIGPRDLRYQEILKIWREQR